MQYRAEIDGLRAVAVVPVILFHAGVKTFAGGFVGVDVFFVLSGYLITSIILQEKASGTFTLAGFYERRVRRILPALFLVMGCCLPAAWLVMFPDELKSFGQSVLAVCLFVSNIFFWLQSGYFDAAVEQKPLLHTWSLAVEEQFYLAFPLLVLLVWRWRRERLLAAVALLGAASFLLCEVGWRMKPSATFFLAPTRAWELLLGSACAIWIAGRRVHSSNPLSLLGLGAIATAVLWLDKTTPFPSFYALLPTFGTALVILYAGPGTVAHQLLSRRVMVGIGLVSYSAYLWHQPLLAFARMFAFDGKSVPLMVAVSLTSFPLAYLSWRFVEQPFRNRRSGPIRSRGRLAAAALAGAAVLVGFGASAHLGDGIPGRFDPALVTLPRSVLDHGRFRSCMKVGAAFAEAPPAGCRLGAASARPDFVLLGDSHAGAIADALDEAATARGRAGWVVGVDACPPVIGVGTHWQGTKDFCPPFQSGLREIVERLGVRLVLLHAKWQSFDDGDLVSAEARPAHEGAGYYERRMMETVASLSRTNARIVILASTPRAGFIVPTTLARWRHLRPDLDLRPTMAEFRHENRTALAAFESPALKSLATVIDLHGPFCGPKPESRCELTKGDRSFFYDQHHLTTFGARQLLVPLGRALD